MHTKSLKYLIFGMDSVCIHMLESTMPSFKMALMKCIGLSIGNNLGRKASKANLYLLVKKIEGMGTC